MTTDQILIKKLDEFIRKYYTNRVIRGLLWVLAGLTVFYLLLVMVEFLFHFNQVIRAGFFFAFLCVSLFLIGRLIFVPIFQLLKIGKILTYDKAALIIGQHFSEIEDKLLNTLQLIRLQDKESEESSLLAASIEQRTREMKVFRFNLVIDFRNNLKYVRYLVVPVLVILGLVLFSPKIISDPTRRIIQFNHDFKKPLPYKIELMNTDLTALEQEDFEVKVRVTGEEIPAELFLKVNEFSYKMNKGHGFEYVHLFKALSANTSFRILAGDFQSEEYIIHVFPKALILNFDILINYPAYINKSDEKLENLGDLTVPEGSKVTWKFHAKDVRNINFRLNKDKLLLVEEGRQTFVGSSRITGSCTYCVAPVNANTLIPDSIVYKINVVNDGYPSIFVNEAVDSLLATNLFCKGTIKDDYGFSKLTFNYRIFLGSDSANLIYKSEPVSIDKSVNNQVFYYSVDLLKLLPEPGQQISYYFEIWDNDGVNGPKSSKSEVKSIKTPSTEEIVAHIGDNEQSINQDFEKSIADSKAMKKNMDELNKKLIDQKDLSWQEKRKVEDVIKANAAINEKIEKIKRNNQENINNEEKSLQVSQRIIDKQKQLNELMDQLLSEEMKKMMEELKELMKQVDKAKLASLLEKMKMSNKELETQLDRNLALMKQIEFDRKVEAMVNDIRKTAESQEKLAKETEGKDKNSADLMKEQEKIGDKTDSLFKQMSALEKLGKELESPADLGNSKPKQESIKKSQEESKNKLLEKKNSEAAGAQKKVAKEMKELADQMEESQEENEDNQLEEDAANIRMILENLVRLSFEQEEMIVKTRVVLRNDPKFTEIVFRQKEFGEKIKVVEDSMNAIAKRQIMIKPVVSKEILSINQNISLALDAMDKPTDLIDTAGITLLVKTIFLPIQNPMFRLATAFGVLNRGTTGWMKMRTELSVFKIGPLSFTTIPGEAYPEVINGGIEAPDGQDFKIQPVEVPSVREMMNGKYKFVFGLANDEIGYIIPKSQWDEEAPFTYNRKDSPYGEENSMGKETAPFLHSNLKEMFKELNQMK
ncbi:MAG: DUF4175 family protein [Mariniphaga sp.]